MNPTLQFVRVLLHQPQGAPPVLVGHLSRYGDIHRMSFEPAYVANAARPTLSLVSRGRNDADTQAILQAVRDERLVAANRLPAWFENLLPEGHNRTRLARQRGCSEDDQFELLAAAGHDLMGALQIEPVPYGELPDAVRSWHVTLGLDVFEPGFVEDPVEDGASLPGVVTKFSAVREGRRYVVHRRHAAGSVIIKLPTTRHPDLVRNEATCYALARAVGIDCAHAEIVHTRDVELPERLGFDECLAVTRFDRSPHGRIHMEEFAQALNLRPSQKYGGRDAMNYYARMLRVLSLLSPRRAADRAEFVRRFVAFILMGNTDAHLKNWAVLYPDGRDPVLAPAYDMVCVAAFLAAGDARDYALNRSIDARMSALTAAELEASLIRAAELRQVNALNKVVRDTVRAAQTDWPALLRDAPPTVRDCILQRLRGGVALTA